MGRSHFLKKWRMLTSPERYKTSPPQHCRNPHKLKHRTWWWEVFRLLKWTVCSTELVIRVCTWPHWYSWNAFCNGHMCFLRDRKWIFKLLRYLKPNRRKHLPSLKKMYCTKRFEMWSDRRAFCVKSQREYFESKGAQFSHFKIIGARSVT